MSTYKTEAIVLAKRAYIEDDRFYYCYTKDQGISEFLVKAAAKSSSKLAGHLEPFAHIQAMVVRGRNKETLAGVELIRNFKIDDFSSFCLASLAAEILIKLSRPNNHEEGVFQLSLKLLSFLAQEGMVEIKRLAVVRFIWQILKILGYWSAADNFISSTNLTILSPEVKKILNNKVLAKHQRVSFRLSKKQLTEIEQYTQAYLKYILESDLKSLNLLAYV